MKKKILIVEDEKALYSALEKKLAKEGFQTFVAKDGQEGLSLARSKKPHLILLDIIMPVMDGLTMLEKLRKTSWGKKIPVIILTNLSEGYEVTRKVKNGINDYLVKSNWKINDVVEVIKCNLEK